MSDESKQREQAGLIQRPVVDDTAHSSEKAEVRMQKPELVFDAGGVKRELAERARRRGVRVRQSVLP